MNFPILIKKMMNKNILFTTKDITKDVELGVHKTSLATMIFISLKYSLHFPSETWCACVPRWMAALNKSDNEWTT